jgi:hypothetical protein
LVQTKSGIFYPSNRSSIESYKQKIGQWVDLINRQWIDPINRQWFDLINRQWIDIINR